jgi:hypothetical protein
VGQRAESALSDRDTEEETMSTAEHQDRQPRLANAAWLVLGGIVGAVLGVVGARLGLGSSETDFVALCAGLVCGAALFRVNAALWQPRAG